MPTNNGWAGFDPRRDARAAATRAAKVEAAAPARRARDRMTRVQRHYLAMTNDPNAEAAQFVADLLADVRHYCDALGLDYAERDGMGRTHYMAERDTTTGDN